MSYQDTLHNILSFAQSIKASSKLAKPPPPRTAHRSPASLPTLSLPIPDGISSSLLGPIACSPTAALSLSQAFARSARRLRAAHESAYQELAIQVSSDPLHRVKQLNSLKSFLENQYREQLRVAEQLAIDQAQQQLNSQQSKQRPAFNQEFIPLLETYFEYNAYPSAPDRAALARKSMMTPRQIEVWFQNHRNRSKKEGKILRRLTLDPLPLKLSLETLETKMPFFIIPKNERKQISELDLLSVQVKDDEDSQISPKAQSINVPSTLKSDAPPHAFPTVYPPSCDYEPFPTNRSAFPPPVWLRTPAKPQLHKAIPDFDAFITDFATKLVIHGFQGELQRRKLSASIKSHRQPWYTGTHTPVYCAPHPALIRLTPTPLLQSYLSPMPNIPAPSSRLHPFRSPSPSAPAASMSSPTQSGSPGHWKVARLPRRIPKNAILPHRGFSPAISDAPSPSPSFSSTSRTSSLTSILLDRRLSSSSSSSLLSSSPSTPVPSEPNIALPDIFDEDALFDQIADVTLAAHNCPCDLQTAAQKTCKAHNFYWMCPI